MISLSPGAFPSTNSLLMPRRLVAAYRTLARGFWGSLVMLLISLPRATTLFRIMIDMECESNRFADNVCYWRGKAEGGDR